MPHPKPRTLVVMRHGQTEWNAERRFQGRTDIPLNETGESQAAQAAPIVAQWAPSRIVASPLSRALVTAQAVGRELGLDVSTHEGLMETFLGGWEGREADEIAAAEPELLSQWRSGDMHVAAGGTGETRVDVARRATAAVDGILADAEPGSTTLVVMHGGAAAALIHALLRLPEEAFVTFEGLGNCSWSVLREDFAGVDRGEVQREGAVGAGDPAESGESAESGAASANAWRLRQHNVWTPGLV
ncbi:histidine phosphatase family protein [Falsarthrobacter nasiphocae]|uniref:Phosphoglycerate mutase n=1 Tax=Falsarthrobacter nasiphocae TaxID=189863 RepID=A0AAE4C912_9MICC|nr:histidine phosphatase family protein [Falsarthrobacter nasiphocae]MDR6892945.1 putative phosphoglycerate mutase [Falsarthrobacter nasiphocae]